MIGYRGDALSGAPGVDPQTILGEGTAVLDVNANQTNPATFTTRGVTEFALANPVVAVAGSSTAPSPSLLTHLNTSNRYNLVIGYNLRDLDSSADNSVQPIALQYRIGSSGNFTNVPAGFVDDVSSGPSLATLVTPVSVTLPAAVENQPQVQIRIIGNDAAGNDEPIGIDDILIFGDPPPPPAVTIADASVTEGNPPGTTTMTFTATLARAIKDTCDFSVETFDSSPDATATPNLDYTPISLNLSIPAGDTSVTFDVPITRDTDIEADEVLVIDVYGEPQACDIFGAGNVFGTIIDDDVASPPDISINNVSVDEGNTGTTLATMTVSLSSPTPAGGVTVADNDYQAANGTLTFAGSTTTQSFNVNVVGDLEVEPDQSFAVALSGLNAPAGVTLGTTTATSTIVNDDSTSFSIAGASVTECTGANTTLNFVVSLSAPAKDPVSVQYATVNGSALAPADYTAASGTLTFSGGQITQNIAITVIGDNLIEADEALQVQLSNPTGGTLVTASATGTIVNDDNAVLTINDVTQPEGNGNGSTPFVFTISSSNPSTTPITVNYQTSDGSAVTPSDFAAGSGSATIPAMATSVSVNVVADSLLEPNETFTVTLSGAQGATIGDAVGIGTILGDDELIPVPALDPRSLGLLIALMLALGMVGIARRR